MFQSKASCANPQFHRPKSVPFAMRAAVEEELDWLKRRGVLEEVNNSDLPASVANRTVGLGTGYWSALRNSYCGYFSTLDLPHAYNLDEDSKKYLTINTHSGLYCYTRLPFGVASVPVLFPAQAVNICKSMNIVPQGLDGDNMVMVRTEVEHLDNIKGVSQCFQECTWHSSEIQQVYLGHRINEKGLQAIDVRAITGP